MKSDAKQTQQYIKDIIDDGQVKSTARTGWFNIKFNVNMLIFCIHRIKEKHMIISDDSEKVFDKSQYFFSWEKVLNIRKLPQIRKSKCEKPTAHNSGLKPRCCSGTRQRRSLLSLVLHTALNCSPAVGTDTTTDITRERKKVPRRWQELRYGNPKEL